MIELIQNIFNSVSAGIEQIIEFLKSAFDFLYTIITFIPNPFRIHLYSFVGVLIVILIVKNVRGDT